MKVELTKEWCMNMAKIEERADDTATMCAWCETRVQGACKSHYDTLTCTHRMIVPTAEQWDSAVEARAAELHEGCRMPMEQAQELAASEMSEGRKALLAAFGAASAAREQDLRGQYPKAARVLAEEVFSLRAALRQKHAEYDDMKSLLLGNARNLNLEGERAREHLRLAIDHIAALNGALEDLARLGATIAICGTKYDDAAARAVLRPNVM